MWLALPKAPLLKRPPKMANPASAAVAMERPWPVQTGTSTESSCFVLETASLVWSNTRGAEQLEERRRWAKLPCLKPQRSMI